MPLFSSKKYEHGMLENIPGSLPFGFFVFILYGSLLPFEYRQVSMEKALSSFANISYLKLGIASRADWIANILIYLPLSFFSLAWLEPKNRSFFFKIPAILTIFLGYSAAAIAIEFCQIFISPRTVSLNDIMAEMIGISMGLLLWLAFGRRLLGYCIEIVKGGNKAIGSALILYGLFYSALCLFPYDFIVSLSDLSWKLSSGNYALFLLPSAFDRPLYSLMGLGLELLLTIPLGILMVKKMVGNSGMIFKLMVLGGLFGFLIEGIQFFLASGVSQGVSVLTRIIGFGLGGVLFPLLQSEKISRLRPYLLYLVMVAAVPYLLVLLSVNGFFSQGWLGYEEAVSKFDKEMLLPFYYHYFSTETRAVLSLLYNGALYAPIGLACWMLGHRRGKFTAGLAALLAGGAAFFVELGKLWLRGKHPDFTNLIIAAVASGMTFGIVEWTLRMLDNDSESSMIFRDLQGVMASSIVKRSPRVPWLFLHPIAPLIVAIAVVAVVFNYPIGKPWLFICLLVYAAVLWFYPSVWLFVIPAFLPVLDLSPWTGWFFMDEFDLFVLVTLAVNWCGRRGGDDKSSMPPWAKIWTALFALSYIISTIKGLLPVPGYDANSFSNYYSRYNSLRVAKGFFSALLLVPLLQRDLTDFRQIKKYLVPGILLGLSGVIAVAVWERNVFSGLMDFSSDFRITSTFSGMHTGGAYLDAFLVFTIPLIICCFLFWRNKFMALMGTGLFVSGIYVLLVTFSRIDYAAVTLSFLIIVLGLVFNYRSDFSHFLWVFLLVCVAGVMVKPVFEGGYIQNRFLQIIRDVGLRTIHWEQAISKMSPDLTTSLFGMGLGSYPRAYFNDPGGNQRPAYHEFKKDGENSYLCLSSGDPLYLGQLINLEPKESYTLSLDVQSSEEKSRLTIPICEKSSLYSFDCKWVSIDVGNTGGKWSSKSLVLPELNLGAGRFYERRPVEFALSNGATGILGIDNVRLINQDGNNLVKNGNFSRGMDRWFFNVDNHHPWHISNLWVSLLFEQGWLGSAFFNILLLYVLTTLGKNISRGDVFSLVLVSSFAGFLTVGLIDSLFDSPRIAMFFYLMVFISILQPGWYFAGQRTEP